MKFLAYFSINNSNQLRWAATSCLHMSIYLMDYYQLMLPKSPVFCHSSVSKYHSFSIKKSGCKSNIICDQNTFLSNSYGGNSINEIRTYDLLYYLH